MKISLGMQLGSSPSEDENPFGRVFVKYFQDRGAKVCFDLDWPDIDIVLMTANPREWAYSVDEVIDYLKNVNSRVLVVQRISECDEQAGAKGVTDRTLRANRYADHTVFTSQWIQNVFASFQLSSPAQSVILNGPDGELFHPQGYVPWDRSGPLRLVTHAKKGMPLYERLNDVLGSSPFKELISFTYLGEVDGVTRFDRARVCPLPPREALRDELVSHHVYLMAAAFETEGHEPSEAALCGLPLLYLDSGCLVEYCSGYGLYFKAQTFERTLLEMTQIYDYFVSRMKTFPYTSLRMGKNYETLFESLLRQKAGLLTRRRLRYQFS